MERLLDFISQTHPNWIYLFLFLGAYFENVVPPVPGDTIVIFSAYLVFTGTIGLGLAILVATAGSFAGFMTMYGVGKLLGRRFVESHRWRFVSTSEFERVERWFEKYGYSIVAANRFLSGARSVISVFAGVTRLSVTGVALLALISCALWNSLLLIAGAQLGENWEAVGIWMRKYNIIVLGGAVAVTAAVIVRWYTRKKGNGKQT